MKRWNTLTNGTTHKTTKGYLRISAGPLRGQYLHRVVAAAKIGRDLTADEEVDHRDRDKLNPHFSNLIIRGEKDHGWVSAKQAWFMRHDDAQQKRQWDEFMTEQAERQEREIAQARADGVPWMNRDGELRKEWERESAERELEQARKERG